MRSYVIVANWTDQGGASGGLYSWHETQPAMILAKAQVHATLAVAAGTGLTDSD